MSRVRFYCMALWIGGGLIAGGFMILVNPVQCVKMAGSMPLAGDCR